MTARGPGKGDNQTMTLSQLMNLSTSVYECKKEIGPGGGWGGGRAGRGGREGMNAATQMTVAGVDVEEEVR